MPSNEIMSMEGQLVGMPLAGPESFSQQQLDYLKRALGVEWQDITSSAVTTSLTVVKLLYCPALKMCMFTWCGSSNLSGNMNVATIAAAYRPSTVVLPAAIMLNNSKYCRGWVASSGEVAMSVNESMTNVGVRFQATWVVGE